MIPAKFRPHVMAYYNFARTADDIADNPSLSPRKKVAMLDELEAVLLDKKKASKATHVAKVLRKSLEMTRITTKHATDLLVAFRMDAKGAKYDSWADLMNYCKYSANPVGRYMLDLHDEGKEAYWPSDMLCSALQVINHIQDMQKDWQEMRRSYIPKNFLAEGKITEKDFLDKAMKPELRKAIDEMLDMTYGLLKEAATLPMVTYSRGLRMEVCTIHNLAVRLLLKLKNNDVLQKHIELSKKDWFLGTITGIGNGIWREKLKMIKM